MTVSYTHLDRWTGAVGEGLLPERVAEEQAVQPVCPGGCLREVRLGGFAAMVAVPAPANPGLIHPVGDQVNIFRGKAELPREAIAAQ